MKEISATDLKQGLDLIPDGEIGSRVSEIDPARETIVYCQKGGWRSAEGIAALQQAGFDRVLNLKGGIAAWSDEVDPNLPKCDSEQRIYGNESTY